MPANEKRYKVSVFDFSAGKSVVEVAVTIVKRP